MDNSLRELTTKGSTPFVSPQLAERVVHIELANGRWRSSASRVAWLQHHCYRVPKSISLPEDSAMFGQMMPSMELMPLILLGLVVGLILLVAGAAWLLTRCLPLRSVNKETATVIRCGVAFAVTAVMLWFAFRIWPPIRGEDPRHKIQLGMTKNQVRTILGSPDEESWAQDGEQTWIYRQDWVGLSYYAVRFAGDGRVEYQWLE